ncbi:hypothetical protein SEUCBS139899_009741 [Sporothrix eucalyptigena]
MLQIKFGLGQHIGDVPAEHLTKFFQCLWATIPVVCITSIIRLRSLLSISVSPDTTFAGVDIAMWSNIEINVAIVCASVPALKPFVSKIAPKLLGSSINSASRSSANVYGANSQRGDTFALTSFNRSAMAAGSGRNPTGSNRDIYVEHTFEILDDGYGKTSREGSERNLVHAKDL